MRDPPFFFLTKFQNESIHTVQCYSINYLFFLICLKLPFACVHITQLFDYYIFWKYAFAKKIIPDVQMVWSTKSMTSLSLRRMNLHMCYRHSVTHVIVNFAPELDSIQDLERSFSSLVGRWPWLDDDCICCLIIMRWFRGMRSCVWFWFDDFIIDNNTLESHINLRIKK